MSFQGDVAGIGLAELLQSLSRSRREGRLALVSKEGLHCHLGMEAGVLHLLPEPGEDGESWRRLARQAWALEFDERLDTVRTSEIARAHRVERIFCLLDSEGVHFKFNSDSFTDADGNPAPPPELKLGSEAPRQVDAPRTTTVKCEGIPVEFLLLEYARLQDELEACAGGFAFSDEDVVSKATVGDRGKVPEGFLAECDGLSNLKEIAHRLAWPIRQARLALSTALAMGAVRILAGEELLPIALDELAAGRIHRATARVRAWLNRVPAGPLALDDAELIVAEWREGGFLKVFNELEAGAARSLLRRLNDALEDPEGSLQRWRDARELRRSDGIIELRILACRAVVGQLEEDRRVATRGQDPDSADEQDETTDPEDAELDEDESSLGDPPAGSAPEPKRRRRGEMPSARELLDFARRLREKGHPARALPLLRMAAHRQPSGAAARVELGAGLVQAGAVDEGAPWILETARDLIEGGSPDKAIPALRSLLEFAPGLGEGRRLLSRARNLVMRRQIIRKHSVIALAVLVVLAVGAWVQMHFERQFESKLAEVAALLEDPVEAQERFDRYFEGDEGERVLGLRNAITTRRRGIETTLRTQWYERYRAAQRECTLGDPELGLRRALEITNPPVLVTIDEPWPVVTDLFNGITVRFQTELEELGEVSVDDPVQEEEERDLASRIEKLLEVFEESGARGDASDLQRELTRMLATLRDRGEQREQDVVERERLDLLSQQELMLSAARAHREAGDLDRSLVVFDRLLESDPTGRLARILTKEVDELREQYDAIMNARRLAREGRHDLAVRELEKLDKDQQFPLPWELSTFPAGAIAELPDGSQRLTPFVIESLPGEGFEILLTLDGHRDERLQVDGPEDRFVWMLRTPERMWDTPGRVDALPVPVGQDHVVCDRSGHITRLANKDRTRWSATVPSLGGVAKAPVFLSQRPGSMLVITEEGDAWILQSKTGELEGPHSLESEPAQDPWPTDHGVAARLRDGRLLEWTHRLKPESLAESERVEQQEPEVSDGYSVTGALAVLRAPSGTHRRLESPWTDWSVEILEDVFRVRAEAGASATTLDGGGFAVERKGNWSFLAWEAPNGILPQGRLWVSDDAGLRAYVP